MFTKGIFYDPQRSKRLEVPRATAPRTQKPAEQPGLIQGQPAGSLNEWHVAQALATLGVSFDYQVPLRGGTARLGGQVLDFLVYTLGRPTPLDVRGRYWHTGIHDDHYDLERALKGKNYGPLLVCWEENCDTQETALNFLRQNLNT